MLFVTFEVGDDRCALEARRVVEVLPFVELSRGPAAPEAVAGFFRYRGRLVPAVDLCQLLLGRPARAHFSTRLLVVRCRDVTGAEHLVGLIAERATGLMQRAPRDFSHPGGVLPDRPCRGPMASDGQGMVQWLDPEHLLPEAVRSALCGPPALPADDTR